MSGDLIRIKTKSGAVFRCLADLLKSAVLECPIFVTREGIILQVSTKDTLTQAELVMIEALLKKEEFLMFDIPETEEGYVCCLGLSTQDFQRATQSIKKTDSVEIGVRSDESQMLFIRIQGNAPGSGTTENGILLKDVTPDNVLAPEYDIENPNVTIMTSEFKKRIAEFKSFVKGAELRISAQKQGVRISLVSSGTISSTVIWGKWSESQPLTYDGKFPVDRVGLITKLAMVAERIKIYASSPDMPVKFMAEVGGGLGTISIYIQPGQ